MKGGSRPCLDYITGKGELSIPDSTAKKEWTKANTIRIVMNLNKSTDKDVLAQLGKVSSKQGYIKALIRKDIADNEK